MRRSPPNRPSLAKTDATRLACLAGKLELMSEKTNAHSVLIRSVAFSPDGTKIVSGSDDKTIKVWDLVNWSRKDHMTVIFPRAFPQSRAAGAADQYASLLSTPARFTAQS